MSHALELQLGTLCGDLRWATRRTGGSIRCNELYNRLSQHGDWDSYTGLTDGILIFVTLKTNMSGTEMGDASKKHVGIVFSGGVYNFGNSAHAVRCEPTVDAFKSRLGAAYGGLSKVSFFYAVPA